MKNVTTDESAVNELRNFMLSNDLIPPPSTELNDEQIDRIFRKTLSKFDTLTGQDGGSSKSNKPRTQWILAASIAGALTLGFGGHYLITGSLGNSPGNGPGQTIMAGVNTLALPGVDLTNIAHAPSAEQALIAAQKAAAANNQEGEGTVQFISKIDHGLELRNLDDPRADNMYIQLVLSEYWIEPDGAARTEQTWGQQVPLNQFDQLDFTAPILGESNSFWHEAPTEYNLRHGPNSFTPWIVAQLPREPQQLADALKAQWGGRYDDQSLLYGIVSLYQTHVVPDDLAGAIWQLLSTNPAIRDLGETTDRIGRPAHAFAFESFPKDRHNDSFDLLLVSPETGRLIGWEWVAVNDATHNITEPTVLGFTVWLESKFVENVGGR